MKQTPPSKADSRSTSKELPCIFRQAGFDDSALIRIREFPDSNLDLDTIYPGCRFSYCSSISPRECWDST
jgi:hypothetical protein